MPGKDSFRRNFPVRRSERKGRAKSMSKLRVNAFSVSLDGYGAGPDQSLDRPLGRGGEALHQWLIPTRTFQAMQGESGGTGGVDDAFAARSMENLGAWILGRNMFGPIRGPWPDEAWRGWWGEEPPYRCPVFVLTHHARPPLEMQGGTVFHFVTGGIGEALERAREAAGACDIRVGGGAATIRQYLQAGLIDELHLAVAPLLLGAGEPLFARLDLPMLGYQVAEQWASERAMHVVLARR
jgi:dihydrofolate reductase